MTKFSRVAAIAAISITMITAAISADAGFAFATDNGITELKSDTIRIDPALLAADQRIVQAAKTNDVTATIGNNGDIIFTPGQGVNAPKSLPVVSEDADDTPDRASSLAELVKDQDTDIVLNAEERCLAGAVFFESKGESLAGQLAVAKVVLARSKSGRFPSSICGVVYQTSQFSFVRGGSMPPINTNKASWRSAVAISQIAPADHWDSPVEGALFFHARRVSPGWRLTRLGTVDNHVFYR